MITVIDASVIYLNFASIQRGHFLLLLMVLPTLHIRVLKRFGQDSLS